MSHPTPPPQNLTAVHATEEQLSIITSLAHDIWNIHYPSIISQSQIDYILAQRYSESALLKKYNQKGTTILLAQVGPMSIGYSVLRTSEDAPDETFIDAFYLHPNHHRKGFGTRFMELVIKQIQTSPTHTVILNVNRQNIGAINFYFRNGFTIRSVVDEKLGHGYIANDFIMERTLDRA